MAQVGFHSCAINYRLDMKTEKLLKEIAKGSHKAFDRLYLQYAPSVERFANAILGNSDDAADIAQSVFLKIWQVRTLLPDIRSFEAWLFTLTRNAVFNFLKKKRNVVSNETELLWEGIDERTPEKETVIRDEIQQAKAIVATQPEQRMKVFLMSRVLGMSYKEIAEELGIATKTVENHIGRVLFEIKSRMDSPKS